MNKSGGKYPAQGKKGTKVVTGSSSAMKTGKSTGKYGGKAKGKMS